MVVMVMLNTLTPHRNATATFALVAVAHPLSTCNGVENVSTANKSGLEVSVVVIELHHRQMSGDVELPKAEKVLQYVTPQAVA